MEAVHFSELILSKEFISINKINDKFKSQLKINLSKRTILKISMTLLQ